MIIEFSIFMKVLKRQEDRSREMEAAGYITTNLSVHYYTFTYNRNDLNSQ